MRKQHAGRRDVSVQSEYRKPGVSSAERTDRAVCGGSFGVTIAAGAA
nr:MAG TPA: hypothetical protein [Caudoviricetes sp.]